MLTFYSLPLLYNTQELETSIKDQVYERHNGSSRISKYAKINTTANIEHSWSLVIVAWLLAES